MSGSLACRGPQECPDCTSPNDDIGADLILTFANGLRIAAPEATVAGAERTRAKHASSLRRILRIVCSTRKTPTSRLRYKIVFLLGRESMIRVFSSMSSYFVL